VLIREYKSGNNNIEIHIENIELLFTKYKKSYIDTFKLTYDHFNHMKEFKLKRTGFLLITSVNSNPSGFFTISLLNNYVGEFGDLYKVSKKLKREDFAKAIYTGINFALKKLSLDGVYSYQNKNALNLVRLAGFKRLAYYERHMSLVLFNCIFKLPLRIINRKLSVSLKPIINFAPIRFNSSLVKTRLSRYLIPYVRLIREDEDYLMSPIFIGFLNEFHEIKDAGDSLMVFGNIDNYKLIVGFEYSDNSA